MSSSILTPEEKAALLEGLSEKNSKTPESVELGGREERLLRRNLGTLGKRLTVFTQTVQNIIARAVRMNCSAVMEPPEVVGPQVGEIVLGEFALAAQLLTSQGILAGFMGVEPLLGFLLVERIFGAQIDLPGPDNSVADRTKLSFLEKQAVSPILESMITTGKGTLLPDHLPALDYVLLSPGLDPEMPPKVEATLMVKIRCDVGKRSGYLHLVLLPAYAETVLGLGSSAMNKKDPRLMVMHLTRAGIECSSNLGFVALTVAELLSLRSGDMLRLDRGQTDPVPVFIEGKQKFVGKPIQRNGVYGVEIQTEAS